MTGAEIVAVISALSACFAIFSVIRNTRRSSEKDIEQRTIERTETNMKLDSIKKDVQRLGEKVALGDAKAEKAHLRIDMLEKEVSDHE